MIKIRKILNNVPDDKAFITHGGSRLFNLEDLREEIKFMSEPEFKEYVNKDKNDFANWVEYVIEDKELADKLRETRDKEKTFNLINSRIIFLKIKLENQEENELNYVEREIERLKQTVNEEGKEVNDKIETEEKEEVKNDEEEERLIREIERQIKDLEKNITTKENDGYKEKEGIEGELLRRLREINEEQPQKERGPKIRELPRESLKVEKETRRIPEPQRMEKEPEHQIPPKKPEEDKKLKNNMKKLEIAVWTMIGFVAGMILGKII